MLECMDSIEFQILYLIFLCGISCLAVILWSFHNQEHKLIKIKFGMKVNLIIALGILIFDSIPYLYTNFYTIPIKIIILSNIYLLLLGLSFIFYELLSFEQKKQFEKKDKDLFPIKIMEDM